MHYIEYTATEVARSTMYTGYGGGEYTRCEFPSTCVPGNYTTFMTELELAELWNGYTCRSHDDSSNIVSYLIHACTPFCYYSLFPKGI